MTANLVSVGRLTVNCIVARDHPHPERVRWRLDDVAAGPLHAALSALLEPLARLHSDEVIVLGRLELSFDLDPSRDAAELARRWAAHLAAGLAAAIAPRGVATQLRFADEACYLARFLADTAAGHGDGKWYYRRFRGWAALPVPAILRSAILDEPARGLAALRALAPAELGAVLAALEPREARRIVQTIIDGDGDGDDAGRDAAAAAVVAAGEAFRARDLASRSPWTVALALTAVAAERLAAPQLPSLARLAAAVAVWWIAREHAGAELCVAAAARTSAARGPAGSLDAAAPDPAPVIALAPARRAEIEAALRPRAAPEPRRDAAAVAHTRFGGMLLLLRRLVDLALEPVFSAERDRAMLRLHLIARCAGPARMRMVLDDALLQRLCGLGDGTTAADAEDWSVASAGRLACELVPALAASRMVMVRSLRVAAARAPRVGAVALAIAEPDGYWLALAPLAPLRPALRGLAPLSGDVLGLPAAAGLAARRDLGLATARACSDMLCHLSAGERPPLEAELALVVGAQHVLHGFARSLPGFSGSSPAFLHDNFLAFPASVEDLGARRVCRMGKPPLATVLALTGGQRGRIDLPWLGGAALELYPGG